MSWRCCLPMPRTATGCQGRTTMKRFLLALFVLAALGAGAYGYRNFFQPAAAAAADAPKEKPAAQGDRAQPVLTAVAQRKAVPRDLGTIGTVQPLAVVALKSRIDSQIEAIHFTDGQEVRAGDLLISLDRRVAEAQMRQVEANLARDRA